MLARRSGLAWRPGEKQVSLRSFQISCMEKKITIQQTSAYRLQAAKAILAVAFFAIIYLIILFLPVVLTIA
jgi:hypothetical protein